MLGPSLFPPCPRPGEGRGELGESWALHHIHLMVGSPLRRTHPPLAHSTPLLLGEHVAALCPLHCALWRASWGHRCLSGPLGCGYCHVVIPGEDLAVAPLQPLPPAAAWSLGTHAWAQPGSLTSRSGCRRLSSRGGCRDARGASPRLRAPVEQPSPHPAPLPKRGLGSLLSLQAAQQK